MLATVVTKDDQVVCDNEVIEVIPENLIEETDLRLYDAERQLSYMQGAESNPKIRLVNAAIKVYTNIFCNARLSQKNRLQLCKHLQAHLVQNEESVNKQFTIIVLCYSIARHLSKTPGVCDTMEEVEHIFTLLQSMGEFACIVPSHSLRVLGCELLALLHRAFSESLSSALSNLAADLEKLGDATDVLSRSKAALVAGYLFKHFDSDKLFFFIKPIVRVIMKQLNNLNALSKFYGFFAVYLALKYTGGMFIDSFKECLILCLDNYNADIRLDKALFSTLSRIFELVIRIDPSFDQGKLPIVAFDALEMSRCNHPLVSLSILQFTKYNLLAASSVITLEQSIELALRGVRNVGASMLNRKLSLEILGIVVYQGNYKALHKADPALIWTLLEELNTIKGGEPEVSYAYGAKQVKKLLELSTWDLDLEKSLGLSERLKHDSMQTRFSELLKKNEVLVYQYTLKQLVIYVLMKIAEQKGEINNIVNMVKHILSYRIQSDEGLEEAKAHAADNKEGIVTKEVAKDDSYKFSKNIRMGTKSFVIKLLRKLILNETRESELVLLMNQFPNILSLSFSFINIEANPKKQAAFTLIKSSIKQCRNVKDTVVPLNDEEETTELHNGLEQYEAQINALIRQYATKSSSYDALESVFGIFYYLCSIPISRDYGTLAKLMGQLAEPLKSMSLAGSVEFSCEKDALKCHFKRLKVLCRLYFVGMKAQFTSHAKSKGEESKFLTEEDRKGILKLFTPE